MQFSMLLVNNNRSKAYLQNLIKNNFIPDKIILLNDSNITLVEHTENDKIISKNTNQKFIRKSKDLNISFDEKEHILKTIKNNNIEYVIVNNIDVNSIDVINEIAKIKNKYIIYSGPGGTILKKDILSQGKKFIHVHPGWLPKYRGSTTLYYSLLAESKIGASVIIFEEEIDKGPILYRKEYKIFEKNIDFDYVLDPLIRAKTLIECFKNNKNLNYIKQEDNEENTTFYIIHPLLKHLSILQYQNST